MANAPKVVTLQIDDQDLSANEGQTVMEVARENEIRIPSLCRLEGLSNAGACRLCLVEVEGSRKLLPACVTSVFEGMVVQTRSERIDRYRRRILELIFSERNHTCSVCVSNGNCELQTLSQDLGMSHVRVPFLYPDLPVDASHDKYGLDHNRCILCTRCVRVCDEIEGAHTWDMMGRGVEARIVADLAERWGDSDTCTACGKCVHVCPTGALFERGRSSSEMRKQTEFLPYLTTMREVKQ